ncbi:hypothetical protein Ocin01_00665 [Orchesella cincta]|uniref:Uncharacterized protein n=1 Tax=Orchesella cincta TaxID=48709 RepID=A0A1D2NL82_ORCCI|nr:hypothetical protein Ocin01_00665 [Orchesella cincta]
MASWDQDIHRIQEIQQLLENRQRYFCGQLNNSCYKVDRVGNPLFFPSLHSGNGENLVEASLGRSMEAHFGSSESKEDPTPSEESKNVSEAGHDADASSDISDLSDSSDEFVEKRQVRNKNKMRRRSNARLMRKWINQNLEKAAVTELDRFGNQAEEGPLGFRRHSTVFPQKYVSFHDNLPSKNDTNVTSVRRISKKVADPIQLLQNRSWKLRGELASRMGDEEMDVSVLNSVTKSSIVYARERLKRAEKSLTAAVISEQKTPVRKTESKSLQKGEIKKPPIQRRSDAVKKAVSRLSERQAEESLKSDLNLREAFALIKINPDPILRLKSVDKDKATNGHDYEFNQNIFGTFEDPEATESLKHLTKLSLEHKQKQRTLIPENKTRRKSSTASTSLRHTTQRRQSMDFRGVYSIDTIPLRDEKANQKQKTSVHRKEQGPGFYAIDKLTGTVI